MTAQEFLEALACLIDEQDCGDAEFVAEVPDGDLYPAVPAFDAVYVTVDPDSTKEPVGHTLGGTS